MPLQKRARIEIYLPTKNKSRYKRLSRAIEAEFLYSFGGSTVVSGIKGLYLASHGERETDEIDLIYADTPFEFDEHASEIATYTDELKAAILEATAEESVLIVVHEVYHST